MTLEELTEKLHDKLCGWDHTDQCRWEYDNWKEDHEWNAKFRLREKVKKLLRDNKWTVEEAAESFDAYCFTLKQYNKIFGNLI